MTVVGDENATGTGTQIPSRFKNCTELGRGGMGVVYRAVDTKLDRDVAIKLLLQENFDDALSRKLFRQEARIIAALNHPSIATAHDLIYGDTADVLVLELIEGRSLDQVVSDDGPLAEDLLIGIAIQVAEGLAYAHTVHRQGVVHRDLKPGNLMLKPDGRVKILDFGLAKLIRRPVSTRTSSGPAIDASTEFVGTPTYSSPEQLAKVPTEVDVRSDVYSLGATLFHLATGRPPFDDDDYTRLIMAVGTQPVPSARVMNPALSPALDALLTRMLAKQPAERPTASDVLGALITIRGTDLAMAARPKRPHPALNALGFALFSAVVMGAGWWIAEALVTRRAPPSVSDAMVEVVSRPPGAQLFVDGEPTGLRTPLVMQMPAKKIMVTLQKGGYTSWQKTLDLQPERTENVDITLAELPERAAND